MEKKMIQNSRRGVLIGLTAILCFVCFALCLLISNRYTKAVAECEVIVADGGAFEQAYVGDEFVVPEATVKYKDTEMAAKKHKIVYPNGQATNASKISLNAAGEYSVIYYAENSGRTYTGSKSFTVLNSAYSVGENSTVTYGTNDKLSSDISGLTVSLAEGDVFTYNKPIDVTDTKKLSNLVSIIPLPETAGSVDAGEIFVKLTDVYDPDNYVLIKTWHTTKMPTPNSYQAAASAEQTLTGIQVIGSSSLVYKNECYDLRIGKDRGYETYCALDAKNGYGNDILTLSLDYGEREVYGSKQFNTFGGSLIVDLDNPLFVMNYWNGFTTGECYLSIYAGAYARSTCNFMISEIYGQDLSVRNYSEDKGPMIAVEYEGSEYAVVGEKFELFDYQALDVNDVDVDCKIKVLYNRTYAVSLDGYGFTPNKSGTYCITYEATGQNGIKTEKNIYVTAYEKDGIPLEIAFGEENGEFVSGTVFRMDKPSVIGASGAYSVRVVATLKADGAIEYELSEKDGKYEFTPLYAGEYILECRVTDYNGAHVETETIDVTAGDFAFAKAPVFPKYFIKGAEYAIERVQCYELSTGAPVGIEAEIEYSFDGVTYQKLNTEKLKIDTENSVTVRYSYQGNVIDEFVIDVIDVKYGTYQMTLPEMFISENVEVSDTLISAYSTTFLFDNEKESILYANKILVTNFSLLFKPSDFNYSTLNFELFDDNASVVISFAVSGNDTEIRVNGNTVGTLKESLNGSQFIMDYLAVSCKLSVNGYSFDAGCDLREVFSDMTAYFKISCDEEIDPTVTGNSNLLVGRINNQTMGSIAVDDYGAPEIFTKMESGAKALGEKITVKDIYVADVISPNVTCYYTVMNSNGEILTSVDGIKLEEIDYRLSYTFELSDYGSYSVEMIAKDNMNNKTTKTVSFTVSDTVAPTVTVNTDTVLAKVGEKVTIKKFTVSDNLDEASDLLVLTTYIAPNGGKYAFEDSFTPTEAGTYLVMITVVDGSNNMTNVYYKVIVE